MSLQFSRTLHQHGFVFKTQNAIVITSEGSASDSKERGIKQPEEDRPSGRSAPCIDGLMESFLSLKTLLHLDGLLALFLLGPAEE